MDLTRERTRYWQRLEKLLEDALIKLSSVASRLDTLSARDMIEALIAGERDPRRLADLARGTMKAKRSALIAALDGRFDDHHASWRGCCSTRSTPSPPRSPRSLPASSTLLADVRTNPSATVNRDRDTATGTPRARDHARFTDAAADRRRAARRDPRHRPGTARR